MILFYFFKTYDKTLMHRRLLYCAQRPLSLSASHFQGENSSIVGVESLVAIPYDQWSLDYQQPKPACIRKDGKCIQALFLTPPDSKKV
jgi:hypothetical protein